MPKISQLPNMGNNATANDLLAIVNAGVTKHISLSDMLDSRKIFNLDRAGNEGGQIHLATPASGTGLKGDDISIDIYQNQFRVFETTAPHRGFFVDLTKCANNASTNIQGAGAEIRILNHKDGGGWNASDSEILVNGYNNTAALLSVVNKKANGAYLDYSSEVFEQYYYPGVTIGAHSSGEFGAVEIVGRLGGYIDFRGPHGKDDMDGRILYWGRDRDAGVQHEYGMFRIHTDYDGPSDDDVTSGRRAETHYGGGTADKAATLRMEINKYGLYSSGDIIGFHQFSDERLKENITNLDSTESLNTILKLQGVNFKWKDSPFKGEQLGLIAQQVEEHVPQVIEEHMRIEDDEPDPANVYKTVDYDKLVPLLIESIKTLTARIEQLESKQ